MPKCAFSYDDKEVLRQKAAMTKHKTLYGIIIDGA